MRKSRSGSSNQLKFAVIFSWNQFILKICKWWMVKEQISWVTCAWTSRRTTWSRPWWWFHSWGTVVRLGSTIVNKAIDVMHDAGCDIQIVMASCCSSTGSYSSWWTTSSSSLSSTPTLPSVPSNKPSLLWMTKWINGEAIRSLSSPRWCCQRRD